MALTGTRPYFIRAIHEWIVDRNWTPYLLVNAEWPGAEVPLGFVEDGKIVLNISPSAVRDLLMGNEELSFSARFGGQPQWVRVPIPSVLGIYARENGEGLFFDADEYSPEPEPTPVHQTSGTVTPIGKAGGASRKPRPALRVVK